MCSTQILEIHIYLLQTVSIFLTVDCTRKQLVYCRANNFGLAPSVEKRGKYLIWEVGIRVGLYTQPFFLFPSHPLPWISDLVISNPAARSSPPPAAGPNLLLRASSAADAPSPFRREGKAAVSSWFPSIGPPRRWSKVTRGTHLGLCSKLTCYSGFVLWICKQYSMDLIRHSCDMHFGSHLGLCSKFNLAWLFPWGAFSNQMGA
jgi:hypothetical protein